jgi:hypothetical protein
MENYIQKLIKAGARDLKISLNVDDGESIVRLTIKFYHEKELLFSAYELGISEFNLQDNLKAIYEDYLRIYINKK